MRCSLTDSLLLSTLECLYSNSTCFPILIRYIKQRYFYNSENPVWFDVDPLLDNPSQSSYSPNTSVETIVKEMMIDRWSQSFSYKDFYKACAPSYCTYSQVIHTYTIIEVIIKLISTIGGLTVLLRLIIPRLVKFIISLSTKIFQNQERQQSEGKQEAILIDFFRVFIFWCSVHHHFLDRLKGTVRKMMKFFHIMLIDLNIFPRRDFSFIVDNTIAKRLGQWATRLFIILFITTLTILSVYTIAQPRSRTQTYSKPSFDFYQRLIKTYGNQLKCACSSISSTYNRFVQIQPRFHQVKQDVSLKSSGQRFLFFPLSFLDLLKCICIG